MDDIAKDAQRYQAMRLAQAMSDTDLPEADAMIEMMDDMCWCADCHDESADALIDYFADGVEPGAAKH